jgi:hypothetical protein
MRRSLVVSLLALSAAGGVFAQTPEYKRVSFAVLANYNYNDKEPWETNPHKATPSGIPPEIWQLDGQKLMITGLVMPLVWEKDGTNEFMLTVSIDLCSYGASPRINELMYVKMTGGRKVLVSQMTVYKVKGTFHLKETVEDGRVTLLYSMDAESVE